MKPSSSAILICLLCGLSDLQAQPVSTQRSVISRPTKDEIDAVTHQLNEKDSTAFEAGIEQLKLWASAGYYPSELSSSWLAELVTMKRYEDVTNLSLGAMLSSPTVSNIKACMPLRIAALSQLKRYDEALQSSKSFFNVCDAKSVDKILPLIGQCLARCHPEDPLIARFCLKTRFSSSFES